MSFLNQSVIPVSAPFLESSNLLLQDAFSDLTTFKPASSLTFIDAGVAGFQTLMAGVQANWVFLLNATQDGVAQIGQVLSQFQDVTAIHIVSHGSAGGLPLGSTDLSLNTLSHYSSALQSWTPHLSKGADVLLYGCDVALGTTGNAFIQELSHIIGADIAASNNLTGSAKQGGDWILEVNTGEIAAKLAFDATTIATYGYTFDTAVSNTQVNTIATGLDAFLTTLQTRLDQVTGSRLPILGTGLTRSTQFFDSAFRTALTTGLTGAATVADIQARVAQAFGGTVTSNPLSVTNSGNFMIDLRVRKAIANPIATSLDLGLNVGADAALKFQNALQVTPNVNYEFGLKFGLKDNQFSLDFSDAKEIGINFGLDLKNTLNNTDAKFGLLNVKVADAGTNFNESLAIDIQTEGSDFKLSPILTENSPNGTQIKLSLSSQSSSFPTLRTQLNLNWDLEPTLSFKKFEVGFRDIAIDLSSLKTLINPIAAKINEILKPIQPVLDSLGQGIPGTNVSIDWTSTLGDLNGDGKQDIFWRHSSGAVSVWLMDGLKLRDFAAIPYNVSMEWTSTIADFDGDGKADVFWRHSSGMNSVWLFNGLTLKQFDLVTNGSQILGNDLLLGDHGKVYRALPIDRNYFSIDIGLNAGAGNDTLYGNQGDDILLGQQGNDYLSGGTGEDDMIGGHNVIGGADGNDTMNGDDNADVMLGDNETITRRPQVGGGWQRYPAPFADVIRDVVRFDDLDRIGGDDVMRGGSGDDIIQGQRGNDALSGDNGDDEMYGQLGNDWIEGGDGQDFMLGDVGIITREYNPDGTPRLNRNGSWHWNACLQMS